MTLIKLEDALAVCSAYCPDDDGSCSKAGHDLREMLDDLESLPTIDVNEKRACWIRNPSGSELYPFTCTSCKESADWKYKFCPNCGIQMDLRSHAEAALDMVDSVMMGD